MRINRLLVTTYILNGESKERIAQWAACLRRTLANEGRVTVAHNGDIKVYARTRRLRATVDAALPRAERRCKL